MRQVGTIGLDQPGRADEVGKGELELLQKAG
jgi:hypothetical protein